MKIKYNSQGNCTLNSAQRFPNAQSSLFVEAGEAGFISTVDQSGRSSRLKVKSSLLKKAELPYSGGVHVY